MLEKLTLKNFQAHPKLTIEFGPDLTCIVGPTGAGKTAVLRALKWVCTNRPNGNAFTTHGTTGTRVTLQAEGHVVRRVRGKQNLYELDGRDLAAFGGDVPAPVASLLNVGPVNFQGQHDAPYWFTESPGEVSRALNQIIDLGIIDDVLAYANGRVRDAAQGARAAAARLEDAKTSRDNLKSILPVAAALEHVEGVYAGYITQRDRAALVADAVAKATTYAQTAKNAAAGAERCAAVAEKGVAWAALAMRHRTLAEHIRKAEVCQAKAKYSPPDFTPLVQAADKYTAAAHRRDQLATAVARAEAAGATMVGARTAAEAAAVAFTEALGERCPLCQKPTK
jgi:energy-coupling factor transporter ATP-binding protein EcfA2